MVVWELWSVVNSFTPPFSSGSATQHSGSRKACSVHGVEMLRKDVFGRADGLLGVTTGDVLIRLHVALLLFKDQRRIRRSGLLRVVDGGEDLIRHLHQLLGLLQRLPVTGAHQSHGVPR